MSTNRSIGYRFASSSLNISALSALLQLGSFRAACRVATTGPIDLATDLEAGDTVDTIVLDAGDRVLVPAQADPKENGIYIASASGAASRATDFDEDAEVISGVYTIINEGAVHTNNFFVLVTADPITVDVTDQDWVAFPSFPASAVFSVFSRTGAVIAAASDYDAVQVDYNNADSGLAAVNVKTALDELDADIAAIDTAILDSADKELTPAATAGNNSDTLLDITTTPLGHVQVDIDGWGVILGNGVTTKDCYFSSDGLPGGVRLIADIVAGDSFVWNGANAGFELDATDIVDFNKET